MHRTICCLSLVLAFAVTTDLRADPPVTAATEKLIDAVVSPKLWPQGTACNPPPVSDQLKAGVSRELWDNPDIQSSYTHLAASGRSYDWFRAIEELQESKAAWCLASGLCHPDAEVRTRCALALAHMEKHESAPFALEVADAVAVPVPDDENGKANARFQHALAELLNVSTGLSIALKPGPDPDGLRAALPQWKHALRDRSGPIKRSDVAKSAIEKIKHNLDQFVITITLWPKPNGEWDPAYELTTVRLSVAPPTPAPDPPLSLTGKPIVAYGRLTPDQVDVLLDALADDGFFDSANPTMPDRTDRHGSVAILCGKTHDSPRFLLAYDWNLSMLCTLDAIRLSVDSEPARLLRKLTAPMTDQRAEWNKTARSEKP